MESVRRAYGERTDNSPAEFHVKGTVRNMPEWYAAFNVQPDQKLFLPPEQRVRIW